MFINFSDLPGQHNLFLDYLYEFDNVKNFYKKNFRDKDSYAAHFEEITSNHPGHRSALPEIILKQYFNLSPSEKTLVNINSIKNNNTIAVVTGQQLGIYGGPLYTFYKIITAIKLCASLKSDYSGYNFIPVFWLEGDDHDFDEVTSVLLTDENNELVTLQYSDNAPEDVNRGSVGSLTFTQDIEKLNNEISGLLRNNDFKVALMTLITSCYREGKTFKQAFRELLFNFFDDYGLVIFDPQDVAVKRILRPVFQNEIDNYAVHSKELVKVSAELEEVYHAQVKINPVNLFLSDSDGRYLIEPAESDFRLKGKRKKITRQMLMEILENEPQRFSANVILRPVCQDYLFPTGFYVGGPGEISYFAQIIPMYKMYNIPQPIIYPRASATLFEKTVVKVIDKYSLSLFDIFSEKEHLHDKVINSLAGNELDTLFASCENEISIPLNNLRVKLAELDKTLDDTASKTKEKIIQHLNLLKEKANEAQKRKFDISLRQINKVSNLIFPDAGLQEREFSIIYFAHKYGMDIFKRIFDEISIDHFEHQIINL